MCKHASLLCMLIDRKKKEEEAEEKECTKNLQVQTGSLQETQVPISSCRIQVQQKAASKRRRGWTGRPSGFGGMGEEGGRGRRGGLEGRRGRSERGGKGRRGRRGRSERGEEGGSCTALSYQVRTESPFLGQKG